MINVTKPYLPSQEKLQLYINEIYKSGWITNNGPLLKILENRLKEYLSVKNLILVTNGTLALQIAYKALKLKGEVITTPFSFVATSSSLLWENLEPVFCDIDKNNLTIDCQNIEALINKNTCAIAPTHVFGNSCNIEEIENLAKKYKLKTIYDASHCFDTNYKNQCILNFGDISTISFHATKLFHTIEGGAIITNNDELAKQIRLLINFGFTSPEKIEEIGINAKMNEFQAAMGLAVLDEIDIIKEKREIIWRYYKENISKNIQLLDWNKNCTLNYAYFPIILKNEETLLNLLKIFNKKQIYPRRYFNPSLNTLDYIKNKPSCPISEDISIRILCLPIYPDLEEEIIIEIVNTLKGIK